MGLPGTSTVLIGAGAAPSISHSVFVVGVFIEFLRQSRTKSLIVENDYT
jgi:hypothetical protein